MKEDGVFLKIGVVKIEGGDFLIRRIMHLWKLQKAFLFNLIQL